MDKISVVIPVYNSRAYLGSCISSVLEQTYKDLEILLVDDGSTDGSAGLCQQFADQDSRVFFFKKKHAGVGAARNYGIQKATGEYILFVDSDDLCDPELVNKLIKAGTGKERTLTLCGLWMIDEPGNPVGYFREDERKMFTRAYAADVLTKWKTNPLCGGVYCKLFHLETLKRYYIRFEEDTSYAEDFCFNLRYLKFVDSVIILPDMLYNYRIGRSGSLTEKNLQEADFNKMWRRRLQVTRLFEETFDYLGLREQCRTAIDAFYWLQIVDMIQLATRKMVDFSAFHTAMGLLRKGEKKKRSCKDLPVKDRLTLSFLRGGQDRILWLYETGRRKTRILRGRERGGN